MCVFGMCQRPGLIRLDDRAEAETSTVAKILHQLLDGAFFHRRINRFRPQHDDIAFRDVATADRCAERDLMMLGDFDIPGGRNIFDAVTVHVALMCHMT